MVFLKVKLFSFDDHVLHSCGVNGSTEKKSHFTLLFELCLVLLLDPIGANELVRSLEPTSFI